MARLFSDLFWIIHDAGKGLFMSRKFVKKPIEVEAFQLGMDVMPEWFLKELNVSVWLKTSGTNETIGAMIETLEGHMLAVNGDFIIKGIKGELYPCKPDIFKESYEEKE